MRRMSAAGLLAAFLFCLSGCTDTSSEPAKVHGKVTLDNQPLAKGKIFFALPGQPPRIFEITDGAYSGEVQPGTNRVEIGAYKTGQPPAGMPDMPAPEVNYLPKRYHSSSELTAEIKSGEENEHNFTVTSK